MASPKERLMELSREDLKKAAKVLKIKGYGNKNKTQLVNMIMEASKEVSGAQYQAEAAILKVREALGLSTHGKVKSRTQGIRKSFKDEGKSPKELASEAMAAMRKAMEMAQGKPKLKKQFIARIKKEMEDFEKELKEMTTVS